MRMKAVSAALLGVCLVFVTAQVRGAASIDAQSDPVPPNIFFLIDFSASMGSCWASSQTDLDGDGNTTYDECDPAQDTSQSVWRLGTVKDAVESIVTNTDTVQFGFAVTDPLSPGNPDGIGDRAVRDGIVVPLGMTKAEFLTEWDEIKGGYAQTGSLKVSSIDSAPLSEALDDVGEYYEAGKYTTRSGYEDVSPIEYYCQESHVIVITDGVTALGAIPADIDKGVLSAGFYPASPDLTDSKPYSVEGAYNQWMDNVASYLGNKDLSVLPNKSSGQHVVTHVISLDVDGSSPDGPQKLFENVVENSGGIYSNVNTPSKLEGELWTIVNSITSGVYVNAPPTISSDGADLYMGYFEVKPESPLYYGHLASFEIDTDPNSSQYGELTSTTPDWDGGEILASRVVGQQDVMSQDNNGTGFRDIYTNMNNDRIPDPFDGTNLNALCPLMLDTSVDAFGNYNGLSEGHDVDQDLDVDIYDCATLLDFVRGYHLAEFASTGQPRGHWKLGDIRHSQVAIADREPKIYTRNPYLREFLEESLPQTVSQCPYTDGTKCSLDVVFVAANSGMLHAFNRQSGDELWAYIPGNLLGETAGAEEKAEILDLMYGETVIMDASPRVDYIWIDGYQGDGQRNPTAADGEQEASEWLRVLMVGEGGGGRTYVALDITDPQYPFILWEDSNDTDSINGIGATTGSPVAGLIFDQNNSPAYDRWVAFYGSGHEEGGSIDARLYIKAFDDTTDTAAVAEVYNDQGIYLDADLDGGGEVSSGTGFPSNPTAIDKDNDGDIDEVFLVNTNGAMYKFVINTADIDSTEGCLFFDPESAYDDSGGGSSYVGARTAAYYAATAAFNSDGSLIIYWGTGSPYDLFTTDYGYLYAVLDSVGCNEGTLYTACRGDGYLQLEPGEKLTGSPIVFAGGVYFSTFVPSTDRCEDGRARLYGLSHTDCSVILDTNGDGTVDSSDESQDYVQIGTGIPSGVVVANNSVYVASSGGLDGASNISEAVLRVDVENDLFSGTVAIQWREIF